MLRRLCSIEEKIEVELDLEDANAELTQQVDALKVHPRRCKHYAQHLYLTC